jgi:hypothetical protein
MKIKRAGLLVGIVVAALAAAPNTGVITQMVVTIQAAHHNGLLPSPGAADVTVAQGNTPPAPAIGLQRLAGELADMQLFIFLDDSTRSAGLGNQLSELKTFLNALPATTQVAVGYMQNGNFALAQAFTADHQKAAHSLRLPLALPGENGSPYFALSSLAKHWPSTQPTNRRTVLMLTDGVDRYYETSVVDDPYVDAAVQDTLKSGLAVYSIYLRGAGFYGRSDWQTNFAQSRLDQVSHETGGHAYFQELSDPVSIAPFLDDFRNRLENQYKLTFQAKGARGVQQVKLRTELPGVKIEGPDRIYVR